MSPPTLPDRVRPRTVRCREQIYLHIERNPVGRVVGTVIGGLTGGAATDLVRHCAGLETGPDVFDLRFVPDIDEAGVCALVAVAGRAGHPIEVVPSTTVRAAIGAVDGGCGLEPIEPTTRYDLYRADFGVAIHDHDLRFVYVNETLAELHGLAPHAHLGFRRDQLFSSRTDAATSALERVVENRLAESREFIAAVDGVRGRFRSYVGPVDLHDGPGVVAVTARVDAVDDSGADTGRLRLVPSPGRPAATIDPADIDLTMREREVLDGLVRGESNAAIAAELYLSVDTVKTYCQRIYRKLGVENRTQAAITSRELRLRPTAGLRRAASG